MKNIYTISGLVIAVILFSLGLVYINGTRNEISFGSVTDGQAYNATSTKSVSGAAMGSFTLLKSTNGVLGSVVVVGATAGQTMNFYDASTTLPWRRTVSATTSLFKLTVPSTALGGTHTFDADFSNGILMEIVGATGTSTITWR